ncbi:DUF3987 domain-containing protein [Qipengyuania citrea]|uniref:DUF3987 domain-containing protein n=1 Tax=Qipengyuania citrea TaxID=225971 RepID=UPI001E2B906F|nr:DUF3987 domain-containing protein [Qipengyuania citrea]MCD1590377.1 DUF3987 domain-containing protein [Qipengyuania citrea]
MNVNNGNGAVPQVPPLWPVKRAEDERPVDLWGQFEPTPLQRGILPKVLDDYVWPTADRMGADPAGLAMAGLVAFAAAIPDAVRLQVKEHDPAWLESARIWVALVGLPSTKKSPILSSALRPINALDRQLFEGWQARHSAWKALTADERKLTTEPLQERLRLSDTTVEAAQEIFRGTANGLAVTSDELSGWFGALDKYGGSKGASADRAFWLQSFNGGPYAINRVGRGSFLLPNLSASIIGGIQPDAIRRIAGDSVDDGLLQRFFPVVLRTAGLGQDVPLPAEAGVYEWAVRLAHQIVAPFPLRFSPNAQAIFRQVQARHHRFGSFEMINKKLAAHIGKLDGLFARLCIVWHVAEKPCTMSVDPIISTDTAERVAKFIATFLLPHAFAFYSGVLGMSDDQEQLEAIAGYILAHKLQEIDHRTIQRSVRSCRKMDRFNTRPLFETLAAMNWLYAVADPDKRNGEPRWFVNPNVYALFAERAEREEARRLQARATILEISGQAG